MSTIPLFESNDSVEDLCLLIKGLHEEMSTVHRKVDVLLALHTNNTEALRDMVAAGPVLVVPNEDEAAPVVAEKTVLASCPACNHTVYDEYDVEQDFGYRTPTGRDTIVQSWCRKCRALEQATSPRKKQRLPDDVRNLGKRARALFKDASKDEAARADLLKASNGNETRQSLYYLTCAAQKRQEGMQLLSQYDQARGVIRKAKKTNPTLEVK